MRHAPPGRGSSVAWVPNHSTIRAGSVKYAKTISGAAAIRSSCSTLVALGPAGIAPRPLLGLGRLLEALQPGRQDVGQEVLQLGEALGTDAEQAACPVAALADQPGLLEDLEVLGDGRLRDLELRGDRARAQLARGEQPQDLAALGLGDCLEDFHRASA